MLSAALKKTLKIRAHALKPVVLIGQQGLSAAVLNELVQALAHHELIKVKLPQLERDEKSLLTAEIIAQSGAALVQSMGRMLTLYKEKEDDLSHSSTPAPKKNKRASKSGARNKAR